MTERYTAETMQTLLHDDEIASLKEAWAVHLENHIETNRLSDEMEQAEQQQLQQQQAVGEHQASEEDDRESDVQRGLLTSGIRGVVLPLRPVLSQVSCYGDSDTKKLLAVKLMRVDITHVEVSYGE
jgi:hypothetical protein